MRFAQSRRAAALVLALSLAACGGKAQFTVGGTITGLFYDGLVLSNNGATISPKANDTSFAFPGSIGYGTAYNVTITTQPRHVTCGVVNGADTAGRFASINVVVNCSRNFYTISGTINGFTTGTLELTNGSTGGSIPLAGGATTFTLPTVLDGSPYSVTVLTQPAGFKCTVVNGNGIMGEAAVTNVVVNCAPLPTSSSDASNT
ncbi:hypothetical protein [Massilia sp. TS11]|uniref:hypothetical protein n=1 Tax=Massilia sp. TS11 TaxID=2908003 RepID=UPI001EDABFA7|nr:hypothetical protein [Massilia sp. TS11]MCG2586387.1 hypothetical protein [Massilia sp. TS11]